jgi:ferritin-like metal-binding protein YciE
MDTARQKVVQYLEEAQATERALVRVLQSQIAMTPRGSYRSALEAHLAQTRDHASRVGRRLRELDHADNPLLALVGAAETVIGQVLALGKTPIDLLRGSGGEEKILKNAKDACATEALEIATYTALERLATSVGDVETARLAASIRADEEQMLDRVLREIRALTDAVVRAEVRGQPVYDVSTTGAADAVFGGEPWPGYDELTAAQVLAALGRAEAAGRARHVQAYERANKNRSSVLRAADSSAA